MWEPTFEVIAQPERASDASVIRYLSRCLALKEQQLQSQALDLESERMELALRRNELNRAVEGLRVAKEALREDQRRLSKPQLVALPQKKRGFFGKLFRRRAA